MELCPEEKCFGCGACAAKCPKNCIKMELDDKGFDRPRIDTSQCINCNSCINVCPATHIPNQQEPKKVYAAWNTHEEAHRRCTSGGISDALVKTVISEGGIAFGAVFNEDLSVCHMGVNTPYAAERLRQSKYVQSRTLQTYKEVKNSLGEGKKVIYTGTPCQIAGLKSYIGENENLYLVDIICHGTPSFKSLYDHIAYIEKREGKHTDAVFFRESGLKLILKENGNAFYEKKSTQDYWYMGFLNGLFYKEACYTCPFATSKRVSDITIGDFWGLEDRSLDEKAKFGVSVVMVNSEKGGLLFNKISEKLEATERNAQEAIRGNSQLRHPMKRHRNYESFYESYRKVGFERSVKKSLRLERIKYWLANIAGRG